MSIFLLCNKSKLNILISFFKMYMDIDWIHYNVLVYIQNINYKESARSIYSKIGTNIHILVGFQTVAELILYKKISKTLFKL